MTTIHKTTTKAAAARRIAKKIASSSTTTTARHQRLLPPRPAVRSYGSTAIVQGGGTAPPLPPFARSPRRAEPMTENSDAVWDDGVSPELALDFDAPNISTSEAAWTWLAGFGSFGVLWLAIKYGYANDGEGQDDNPAYPHANDAVDVDHSSPATSSSA